MPHDTYPFPPDESLAAETAAARSDDYEVTLLALVREWIEQRGGEVSGLSGYLLSVSRVGTFPNTRLVLRYRSHAGGTYEAAWPIWDEGTTDGHGHPWRYESPGSHGGVVAANWLDGSIKADDDPL
jgi:hypothetical protein